MDENTFELPPTIGGEEANVHYTAIYQNAGNHNEPACDAYEIKAVFE